MNRFDPDFNGIDTTTSRPFSGGFPDGLWMIAIFYGLFLVLAVVMVLVVIITLMLGGGFNFMPLVPAVLLTAVFLPPIMLLLQRSINALYYSLALLGISFLGVIASYIFSPNVLMAFAALVPLVIQLYICYYLFKLKSEKLIGGLA